MDIEEVNSMVAEVQPEAPKEELTPERKAALERAGALSDMLISARQDIQGIEMNMLRLNIHLKYWTARAEVLKDDTGELGDKTRGNLDKITKQIAGNAMDREETERFIEYLMTEMAGDTKESV